MGRGWLGSVGYTDSTNPGSINYVVFNGCNSRVAQGGVQSICI